jgi:putative addiction module CopG family antidote
MNVSLPGEFKAFVDARVARGGYGSTSEFVRDLIRRERDRQHLRTLLLDGRASAAGSDIDAAVAYLRNEGGDSLALEFIDDLEHAVGQIRRSSHIGSLLFSYELSMPELRVWRPKKFPYRIFYVPSGDRIEVWRVLRGRRDIPGAFGTSD